MNLSDEIKEKIDLKSYLERRSGATVKSEGASWHVRPCPFCNSTKGCKIKKSNPKSFNCFSCGASGSVIDVCMKLDGIDGKAAIAKLAKDEGIERVRRIEKKGVEEPSTKPAKPTKPTKPAYLAIVDNCRPATIAECQRWLENVRHFPPSLAEKGAAMIADSVMVNDYQGQKSLIFSIRDISGALIGIQQQTIDGKNFKGMDTNKRVGKDGKIGGYFFAGNDQKRLVIVESVSNALALASAGFQAVCIYSAVNTGMIEALQNQYPGKELFLCLDAGMEEKQAQACRQYGIDGLWFDAETPSGQAMQNGYDINDLLIELDENNFAGRVNAMILQAARKTKSAIEHFAPAIATMPEPEPEPPAQDEIEEIEEVINLPSIPDEVLEQATIAEIMTAIQELSNKNYLLFSAATGIGKTTTMAKAAIAKALAGDAVTMFADTITSAKEIVGKLKKLLLEDGHEDITVSLNVSGLGQSDEKKRDIREKIGQIAVSTYGYLGRYGHTGKIFAIADKLIADRIVFCDEIGELYKRCQALEPLAARYLRQNETFSRLVKCPARSGTGSCENCKMGFMRKAMNKRTKERKFYRDFPITSMSDHMKQADFSGLAKDIFDTSTYLQADKTLFVRYLNERLSTEIEENESDSFHDYLLHLHKYLLNPHLRMNIAIDKGGEVAELNVEEKEQINYPVGTCKVPHLAGIDTLPLLQLLQAKQLVLTSATIPAHFTEIIQEVAAKQSWQGDYVQIPEIPFQFNLAQLNTQKHLSAERIVRTLKELSARPEKGLIVTARRIEADALHQLGAKQDLDITYFTERIFRTMLKDGGNLEREGEKKYILTYARSAITRAINLPGLQLLIVDCQHMLPKLALACRGDADELKAAIYRELNDNLLQIVGRLLRSKLARIPGKTVKDEREIAVIFHGIPDGFTPQLDDSLFYSHEIITDTWLPSGAKGEVQAVVDAVAAIFDGKPVPNARGAEKKALAEKGNSTLSKKQRKISAQEREKAKAEKAKKARDEKLKKARELLIDGNTENQVKDKLHLYRMTKKEYKKFWQDIIK